MNRDRHIARNEPRRPLYQQVADALRQQIQSGTLADRLPTEPALADRFGVSIITVRGAVGRLVEEGLVERRQGSGTYVREHARPRIAIYKEVEPDHPRSGRVHASQLRALRHFFHAHGYGVSVYQGDTEPGDESRAMTARELLEDLDRIGFVGAVAWTLADPETWLKPLESRGIPVVGIGGTPSAYVVRREHQTITDRAVQYLHDECGRHRLALMSWAGDKPVGFRDPDQWSDAFRRALAAQGLTHHPEWVPQDLMVTAPGAGWSQVREIFTARRDQRPDGLLVTDDHLLLDAVLAIQELGLRVPEDLTIVAGADAELAGTLPVPIARFGGDPAAYVETAAQMLLDRLAGHEPEPAVRDFPFRWYGTDIEPARQAGALAQAVAKRPAALTEHPDV